MGLRSKILNFKSTFDKVFIPQIPVKFPVSIFNFKFHLKFLYFSIQILPSVEFCWTLIIFNRAGAG